METMEDLLKEFENVKEPKRGDIVKATVEFIRDNQVVLNIPGLIGVDAYMYEDQYSTNPNESIKNLKVGDVIDVQICKKGSSDGESQGVLVSRLPLLRKKDQELLIEAYNENKNIDVTVKKAVNKGLLAEYAGCEIFIPESTLDLSNGSLDAYVGKELTVRIIDKKNDKGKDKFIASRKVVLFEELSQKRKAEAEKINVGDTLRGTIVKFEPFGILVQIGEVRAILRYDQVSHFKNEKAENLFQVSDDVTVKVIAKEGSRILVSIKALIPSPYAVYTNKNEIGQLVKGKVVKKIPAGLIIELDKGVSALLHKSEYSWNPNDNLDMCVKIGDELETKIIKLDAENERISLSRKVLIDDPWKNVDVKKGDLINATVVEVKANGIAVLACGVDAFIPLKEAGLAKNAKLEDYFHKDDKIDCLAIDVNKAKWVLTLSVKAYNEKQEKEEFEKYKAENNDTSNATLGDIFADKLEK